METCVELRYELTGTGWSRARLSVRESSVDLKASYLSDALGALLRAVIAIRDGAPEARFAWYVEPGEYRWQLQRLDDVDLRIRIHAVPELLGRRPDEEGQVVFDATCASVDFSSAVVDAARRLLDQHGMENYHALWVEHEFPASELQLLEQPHK